MTFYQCPDHRYPEMTRFVCHTTEEAFEPVMVWLNDVTPGDFIVVEAEDISANEFYPSHWKEVYIGQTSNAALFKLTWDVVKP